MTFERGCFSGVLMMARGEFDNQGIINLRFPMIKGEASAGKIWRNHDKN
jgi:hypothetical protein